jgi:hypothetical protein
VRRDLQEIKVLQDLQDPHLRVLLEERVTEDLKVEKDR